MTQIENIAPEIDNISSSDSPELDNSESALSKKLERGIKLAIIGPPGSGKSLLMNELQQRFGSRDAFIFHANPDGEGAWYHRNYNNPDTEKFRVKGPYSDEFVDYCEDCLKTWDGQLLLVDTGGKITKELNKIMSSGVTHSIILTNDLSSVDSWKQLCDKNNVNTLAVIHSKKDQLTDPDDNERLRLISEKFSRDQKISKFVVGTVCNIRRGQDVENSDVISETVESVHKLIKNNIDYQQAHENANLDPDIVNVSDFMDGFPSEIRETTLNNGDKNQYRWFSYDSIPMIYEKIANFPGKRESIKLDGPLSSWAAIAFAAACEENDCTNIKIKGINYGFVDVKKMPQSEKGSGVNWKFDKIEDFNGKPVYLLENDINKSVKLLHPGEMDKMSVPELPDDCVVVVSTAGPNWLKASIALSYKDKCSAIAAFEPPNSYTIAWSKDKTELASHILINRQD